jgi:hypothetical protein
MPELSIQNPQKQRGAIRRKDFQYDSMDIQGALNQRNTMLELHSVHLTSGLGDFRSRETSEISATQS